ncbi:14840_t:CDS:2 [Entrophospora sp. SA101]|nr:14840_t:CDS:2 [Entrophospora sp. SA101]
MASPVKVCLGIDIGGTKFAFTHTTVSSIIDSSYFKISETMSPLSNNNNNKEHNYRLLTGQSFKPEDFNKIIDDHILKQLNNSYDNNYKIVSIGISICGLTDEEGVISLCEIGNLSGWNPVKCVKEKFGNDIKVKVINDSDAALEYVRREWPGVKDLAIIIAVLKGHMNAARNFGIAPIFIPRHYTSRVPNYYTTDSTNLILDPPPTKLLDELAGGRELVRIITEEIGVSITDAILHEEEKGLEIDKKIVNVVLNWATVFGVTIANIICIFNPKVVVIAGGLLNFPFYWDRVLELVKLYTSNLIPELWSETIFVKSRWGNDLVVRAPSKFIEDFLFGSHFTEPSTSSGSSFPAVEPNTMDGSLSSSLITDQHAELGMESNTIDQTMYQPVKLSMEPNTMDGPVMIAAQQAMTNDPFL